MLQLGKTCGLLNHVRRSTSAVRASVSQFAYPETEENRVKQIQRRLQAKEKSSLTFSEIARRCEITSPYCAQLFFGRARLDGSVAEKLKRVVPALSDEDLRLMQQCPTRQIDPNTAKDPFVSRLYEIVDQYSESLKAIFNEDFGDGIMSAIDFHIDVQKKTGVHGEARVHITMNGKFLPYIVQHVESTDGTKRGKN